MISKLLWSLVLVLAVVPATVTAQEVGAGNAAAATLASHSPIVSSARAFIAGHTRRIRGDTLRAQTADATQNEHTCVKHRAQVDAAKQAAILQRLQREGLVDPVEAETFPGGLTAGVFPALKDEPSACPHLPQPFYSAPGSATGGHHSYPGGLPVHESFNEQSNLNLADTYRRIYGTSRRDGLPEIGDEDPDADDGFFIDQDIIVAAPLWHDWAKPIVFQWNADGTEFPELNFGGNGTTDSYGAAGNSKTGAHHILGLAETIARGLSPEFVITQASAHSAPTSGNEYKVVNWLRTAAILASVDPLARGYLAKDAEGKLRLPPVRALGSMDLNAQPGSPLNLLIEYTTHNLSDADFTFSGPAVTEAEALLRNLAAHFGYDPADVANYNNRYRNPALSYLTGERLTVIYSKRGVDGVLRELSKLRRLGAL
jgi:hypothetical protein